MDIEKYLENLPNGWYRTEGQQLEAFQKELEIEIPPGHLLDGVEVIIVAHREGTDDVLCWHVNESQRFTVVHLTWIMKEEINTDHPTVEMDGTFQDFINYEDAIMKFLSSSNRSDF